MRRPASLRHSAIPFALVLVLVVILTALWNVVLVQDYEVLKELAGAGEGEFHWFYIALGSTLFVAIIVLASILGVQLLTNVRWSQRQANFVASVSHELNSPLSSIKLFAQTLRQGDISDQDRSRFVGKILIDADRLSRLIANILRAAEVDNRGDVLEVEPTELDFADYLREYTEDLRTVHVGKIEIELGQLDNVWVEIDPVMFRQVLDNLVDNAIRYSGESPARIEFRMEQREGEVELQAVDQGVGIAKDRLPRIFDRFYRAGRGGQGLGIGLSIVRAIVRSHGGRVGARSAGAGRGTAIWIRLPALQHVEAVG
ncbi:MAG: sensor histidine kinase [Planctomycetota bacterium]|jgi:signal transduction histidine kinase